MAGPDVKIEWFVYNVGPSAKEAILANSIDLTYVRPNPAINAYAKSRGRSASLRERPTVAPPSSYSRTLSSR
jgi:hypothetical protein